MVATTETKPATARSSIYDVQKGSELYYIVQLQDDGTWKYLTVGYKHSGSAWASIGRRMAREQREIPQVS